MDMKNKRTCRSGLLPNERGNWLAWALPANAVKPGLNSDTGGFLIWMLVIIAGCLVLFVIVYAIRESWLKSDPTPAGGDFSLHDLRKLLRDGKMSQEEFERAKGRILAAHKAQSPGKKGSPPEDKEEDSEDTPPTED